MSGRANDTAAAMIVSTPSTIIVHVARVVVSVQIGDSTAYRPAAAATDSSHRIHFLIAILLPGSLDLAVPRSSS
jgi:hypothetical protein